MKKKIVALILGVAVLTGCTKQAYEGAVVGGAAGSAVGAILDEENPWRGAFIGGIVGAVVTGTIVEISSKAAEECVSYDRPVVYRCYRCRENIIIKAIPGRWVGKCRIVKLKYFKGRNLIKVKEKKVCVKKTPPFKRGWVPPGHRH
ncbi:YMGG-like Gly-zipper [Persephonella hydrogeniphila]|uniref:YMGG-like Gly-zipper n=1 Tax=Persephonella hydrogeniphila TaxID=198703 RepID=A0A285NMI9_9AQUI|nr:YMGG-like glycine zipper-containing protein [Persephonella hydrogeniphila]SNZ10177.1 YMGG-like Gly-zipper [Persephonella hydrogeniphila]